MATRFAVASTSWNTPSTWDNGAVPVAGDTVYPNGFTVPIDTDINVASLNNNISNVYLPNIATPAMTSNTAPTGTVISSNNSGTAYIAFNQDNSTNPYWSSGVNGTGWLGYTFSSGKVIKRYFIKQQGAGQIYNPRTWTFEGSNDGFATAGVQLDQVLSYTTNANYTSVLLSNTTSYTSYRINITATGGSYAPGIAELEMTESTTASPVYGVTTGGSFTVPSSLVGTRNIEFSGAGIVMTTTASTMIQTYHNSNNIVNFNKTGSGYIINPGWYSNATTYYGIVHYGTAGGVININGDLYGGTVNAGNPGAAVAIWPSAGATTLNIFGKVYGARGGTSTNTIYLLNSGSTLNVTGDLVPNSQIGSPCITNNGTNTINITGSIISDIGSGISSASYTCFLTVVGNIGYTNASSTTAITLGVSSSVNVTGTLAAPPNAVGISTSGSGAITITGAMTGGTGGTNGACIVSTGTGAINIPTGTITAGTGAVAINAPSATLVTVGNSPLINSNNYMAVYAPRIRFYTGAQVEWTFQTSTGGTKILRNADGSSGLPSYIHVKIGQPFGPNRDIIGACVIPPANAVGVGIPVSAITPVDDPVPVIVGTLQLTGEDLLNAISTSSNVVATRLKNVATVETTGDQLAAFNRI